MCNTMIGYKRLKISLRAVLCALAKDTHALAEDWSPDKGVAARSEHRVQPGRLPVTQYSVGLCLAGVAVGLSLICHLCFKYQHMQWVRYDT